MTTKAHDSGSIISVGVCDSFRRLIDLHGSQASQNFSMDQSFTRVRPGFPQVIIQIYPLLKRLGDVSQPTEPAFFVFPESFTSVDDFCAFGL